MGFFSDSCVSVCSKCDLCTESLAYLMNAEMDGKYIRTDSFLITVDVMASDTMFIYADRHVSCEGWAIIDYKWMLKVDS